MGYHDKTDVFNEIINNTITQDLLKLGYIHTKDYKWIKEDNNEFMKGITAYSLKSMSKAFLWGVSLNFCPSFNGKLKWHKTIKSADINDFYIDQLDYKEPKECTISLFEYKSEKDLIKRTKDIISIIINESESFYSRIHHLKDLDILFLEKINRKFIRFGFHNYIQHKLAYSFLLKKIGNIAEANKYYNEYKSLFIDKYNFKELDDIYNSLK